MIKFVRVWALLAVLTVVAAACDGATTRPPETVSTDPDEAFVQSVGEGEGQVNIISWAGYIEDGSTDPAFDWVTQFEADTGCEVVNTTAGTSDEMVALMQGGGDYDLVTASGDASLRLVHGGTLQPINQELIPSYSLVDERLQDAPWHTVDTDGDGTTEHYGVPYQWGYNVLLYSTDVFGSKAPDSWSVVFEEQKLPDGESNKGRVQAYDGAIYIADAALYLKATRPELGIDDPYALTLDQFNAALDLLRQQRELVGRYWHDAFIQMDDFAGGDAVASSSWPFQANYVEGSGTRFKSVAPKEGVTGWADTTMMHVNAPNPNCAYKWMEWSLNEKLQGDLAAWFGTVPANLAACEGNEILTDEGCTINGLNDFDRILFWKTPQADCFVPGGPEACIPYHLWVTNYVAVIGGR